MGDPDSNRPDVTRRGSRAGAPPGKRVRARGACIATMMPGTHAGCGRPHRPGVGGPWAWAGRTHGGGAALELTRGTTCHVPAAMHGPWTE